MVVSIFLRLLFTRRVIFIYKKVNLNCTSMEPVQLLEDRIVELEKQVYGLGKVLQLDDPQPETSITNNLLHANTLISSALSGREKINEAIKRLPELNKHLDISSEELDMPVEAKLHFLLLLEREINENHKCLNEIQELMPVLETDSLKDVPELSEKLNELSLKQLKIHEEAQEFMKNMYSVFCMYNDIVDSITKTLISLDNAITRAESSQK